MQPGTGPSSVTSTTKCRQRTGRRYPLVDRPSWNSGHSSMRSGGRRTRCAEEWMGQVTPSAGHDSGLAVLTTSVAPGLLAMTLTSRGSLWRRHEPSSRTKSGQRPGSILVTVSDTSWPASSPAPTRCRPRTDVGRTVRDRAATIHGWTVALVEHLVRRRIKHHEPSVLFHLSSIA